MNAILLLGKIQISTHPVLQYLTLDGICTLTRLEAGHFAALVTVNPSEQPQRPVDRRGRRRSFQYTNAHWHSHRASPVELRPQALTVTKASTLAGGLSRIALLDTQFLPARFWQGLLLRNVSVLPFCWCRIC